MNGSMFKLSWREAWNSRLGGSVDAPVNQSFDVSFIQVRLFGTIHYTLS